MKLVVLALIAASLTAVVPSCGGGGDTQPSPRALTTPSPSVLDEPSPTVLEQSGVRILLEADASRLPPGTDVDDAMEGVKDVLERRITAFDMADFEIEVEGTDRLSVRLAGVTPEEARELLGTTAHLEFRKPVLDESGNVVCETADGRTYALS